eukprot:303142-Lingulodinium_polyedra.AAC.1
MFGPPSCVEKGRSAWAEGASRCKWPCRLNDMANRPTGSCPKVAVSRARWRRSEKSKWLCRVNETADLH